MLDMVLCYSYTSPLQTDTFQANSPLRLLSPPLACWQAGSPLAAVAGQPGLEGPCQQLQRRQPAQRCQTQCQTCAEAQATQPPHWQL